MSAALRHTKFSQKAWIPPQDGQWTIADYMRLENPPGFYYELIEGVLYMSPSPNVPHQRAVKNLFKRLDAFVEKHQLGEVFIAPLDVVLDKGETETVVVPDILFVSKARERILKNDNIQGAPDLVIEVLSPSSGRRDRQEKFSVYFSRDVLEYWIVDPVERAIEVWIRRSNSYVLSGRFKSGKRASSEVLPKFSVAVNDVL